MKRKICDVEFVYKLLNSLVDRPQFLGRVSYEADSRDRNTSLDVSVNCLVLAHT